MINIIKSKFLVNSKVALEVEGNIYVSPAMYTLIEKAETQKEIKHLLNNIPIIKGPKKPETVYADVLNMLKQEVKVSK